jgi:hypothetical protein
MSQIAPPMLLDLLARRQTLISQSVATRRHIGWNIAPLYAFISIT